jgi:hypothetical protein
MDYPSVQQVFLAEAATRVAPGLSDADLEPDG